MVALGSCCRWILMSYDCLMAGVLPAVSAIGLDGCAGKI